MKMYQWYKVIDRPLPRMAIAFLAVLASFGIFGSVASARGDSRPSADELAALEYIPVADAQGNQLYDDNGMAVIVRLGELNDMERHVRALYDRRYEMRDKSPADRARFEGLVRDLFPDERTASAHLNEIDRAALSGRGHPQRGGTEILTGGLISGEDWLEQPTAGVLDPRNFVSRVSPDRLDGLVRNGK